MASDRGVPSLRQSAASAAPIAERLRRHSTTRIIVLEDLQIMFLPVPKSGCTSVLWTLAALANVDGERLERSQMAEISRSMAIHDTSRWDPRHLWSTHSQLEQNRIQSDPSWLRFSTVRNPATRLWSAWQSKLLLQEPRFVQRFGDLPWFPHRVGTVDEIVEAFREFVHALDVAPHEAPHDAHWGPQALLIEPFDLNFVGRSEQMDETMRRLVAHVGERAGVATDVPRENATPIPYHRSVYDAATAGIVNRLFEADFLAFGYPMLDDNQAPRVNEWRAAATVQVPVARQLVDRHLRIGELLAALAESERTRRRRMARLEERIRDLEEAKRQADQLVSEMERSRSWRLTRSLRTFRRR